jgi:hypothetical protein
LAIAVFGRNRNQSAGLRISLKTPLARTMSDLAA